MSWKVTRRSVLAVGAFGGAAVVGRAVESSLAPWPKAPAPTAAAGQGASRSTTQVGPRPGAASFGVLSRAAEVSRYAGAPPLAWGTALAGVTSRLAPMTTVALTFDACGGLRGNGYDHRLVTLLRRHQVPATLFLNARWIRANPGIAAELASDRLFEIANHGVRHVPLSVTGRSAYGIRGTADVGQVWDELVGGVEAIQELTGRVPQWFRTGTAYYDNVALRVVHDLGLQVAGFDVNADAGATLSPLRVAGQLATVRPGSIVIAHVNHPHGGTAAGYELGLPRLLERGLVFGRLITVHP